MSIQEELFYLQDKKYADFQSKLIPTIPRETIIGVRIPELRKLAKSYISETQHRGCGAGEPQWQACAGEPQWQDCAGESQWQACAGKLRWQACAGKPQWQVFIEELPHKYYDENILHGMLVSEMKNYEACIEAVDAFLPYVDNWAVCDTMSPKIFKKHRTELLEKIKKWIASEREYTCRFGIRMLMVHFLEEDYNPEYLKLVADVSSEDYYVNMMIAWFFATALAKQWESVIPYISKEKLPVWVHNKTIQKAGESYRITDAQKTYLKELKR